MSVPMPADMNDLPSTSLIAVLLLLQLIYNMVKPPLQCHNYKDSKWVGLNTAVASCCVHIDPKLDWHLSSDTKALHLLHSSRLAYLQRTDSGRNMEIPGSSESAALPLLGTRFKWSPYFYISETTRQRQTPYKADSIQSPLHRELIIKSAQAGKGRKQRQQHPQQVYK